jgi:putative oxygen-independent coproporphyrinogen III oxidase
MTSDDSPPWLTTRAAYIHVPFCAHHCGYCDFAVATGVDHQIDLYLEALEMELATLGEPRPVETIFIGGGTPTHLSVRQLERVLRMLGRWLPLQGVGSQESGVRNAGSSGFLLTPDSCSLTPEFSIESTPESLTNEKVAILAEHGVNRVSIGVQSFDARTLAGLDRRHSADDVPRAIECVCRRIANFSLDLIFGVPGQTLADWQNDIRRAIEFEPPHVSTYGLTYEKGTPLWKNRERGEVRPLSEDDELAMYEHALDTLAAAGIEQYEVSNHAKPGSECRHNQTYWGNLAYFGFGVGAARYVDGRRELNTRSLDTYLRRVLSGESPMIQSEELTGPERARETLGLQLRRRRGIVREEFAGQTGFSLDDLTGEALKRLAGLELIRDDGHCVTLTRRGVCLADSVITELMAGSSGC